MISFMKMSIIASLLLDSFIRTRFEKMFVYAKREGGDKFFFLLNIFYFHLYEEKIMSGKYQSLLLWSHKNQDFYFTQKCFEADTQNHNGITFFMISIKIILNSFNLTYDDMCLRKFSVCNVRDDDNDENVELVIKFRSKILNFNTFFFSHIVQHKNSQINLNYLLLYTYELQISISSLKNAVINNFLSHIRIYTIFSYFYVVFNSYMQ